MRLRDRTKIAVYDPGLNPDSEKKKLSAIKAITRKYRHNMNQVCRLNNNVFIMQY